MKVRVKRLIKCVAFMAVLTVLLLTVSYMFAPKDNTKSSGITNPNANGFFSEPENSIDVAIIGNSDAYSGFSPMELWKNYGITSYVSAEGQQMVSGAYSMLSKIFTCQKPKVVILEVDGIFTKGDITKNAAHIVNSSLGSSFSIFQYHDRWKSVKAGEMFKKPVYTAHCVTKGQMLSNDIKGYMGGEYMRPTDKSAKIPVSSRASFNAFVKLCRDNNAELLLVSVPSQSSWGYEKHNAIQKLADDNGLKFIDLNIDRKSFNFDWHTDSRDKGNHLNNSGARKVSMYIGNYLKDNYSIKDRRNDEKYSKWNKDYENYSRKVKI